MRHRENVIIRTLSDISMIEGIGYVTDVIRQGRISDNERSYCLLTRFADGVCVAARRQKCSDVFTVWKEEN